jgi:hypothetical protein
MRFEKKVSVITVQSRKVSREGKDMTFHDLHYVVAGEGVGTIAIPDEFAVQLAQAQGKEVTLQIEARPDRRTNWLYRLDVVGVVGARPQVATA